jgi:hypothetical protein
MPKQAKFTVEYFLHDCNYRITVFTIEQKYGNDGYALWFKLLETLGATKGHYLDLNKDVTLNFLSSKAHMDKERCLAIITELSALEAIDQELWENYKIIWCQNFVDRLTKVYADRRNSPPPKPIISNDNGSLQITQFVHLNTSDYGVILSNTAENDVIRGNTADSVGQLHILNNTVLNSTELNSTKGKRDYAPSVFLTELEYLSLVERFTEKDAVKKIEALSLYKQSSGKKYKSDYFTILNWARKDEDKKNEPVMPKKRFEPGVPDDYDKQLAEHMRKVEENKKNV